MIDAHDNCPDIANADQLDSDDDGNGDACDDDADNDGIDNNNDNCPLVANADQRDGNKDGVGDACTNDCDGDSIHDDEDACPCNGVIARTDFRAIQVKANVKVIAEGQNKTMVLSFEL